MTLLPSHSLLQWMDDETLFSLVSRHHRLSGAIHARDTCRRFFGHSRSGSQHDLPCNIGQFERNTAGLLGDAVSIIRDRTVLPFYLPFRDVLVAEEAYEILRGPALGSLKYKLGLLTSRFRANHPLKACDSCMREDLASAGVAYWHRVHQLPGVWCCPRHGELLRQSLLKATGVERFFWHLPASASLAPAELGKDRTLTAESLQRLTRLACLISDYLQWGNQIDQPRLLGTYRRALSDRGDLSPGGSLRLVRVSADFLEHVQHLRAISDFGHLPEDHQAVADQIGRVLRPPRGGTHPLRHLLVIDWLFGDWRSFLRRYAIDDRSDTPAIEPVASPSDDARSRLLAALSDEGESITAAARSIGVDIATAVGWARDAGMKVRARPKLLKLEPLAKLREDLLGGASTAEAAASNGFSIPTVNRVLRSDPPLAAQAQQARRLRLLNEHRTQWTTATTEHPGLSVKAVRTLIPACYAWLYRNDRHWLATSAATLPTAHSNSGLRVDWNARDIELQAVVQQTILELVDEAPDRAVQLWHIYQRVPSLKAKLGHLDRLPRTRTAIERTVSRRRTSRRGLFA